MPAIRTRGIPKPRPTPRPTFNVVESEFELLLSAAAVPLLEEALEARLVLLKLVDEVKEEEGEDEDEDVDVVEELMALATVILK
jgi:hypothetical protein